MAKSRFARRHALGLAGSVLVASALIGCGTVTGAGSGTVGGASQSSTVTGAGSGTVGGASQSTHFCVAPIEGSPEEATLARGHCSSSSFGVAPIEGTPEQTAVDLGR